MEMEQIQSSLIRAVGYDEHRDMTMRVELLPGKIYEFSWVPHNIYLALVQSASPGRFFVEHIKDNYSYPCSEI